MKKNIFFINGFFLKLIAFLLMTMDHIGIFLLMNPDTIQVGEIFRLFGRFAFPLFVLMLVEGVRHTKSFAKYALRLGIVATVIIALVSAILLVVGSLLMANNAFVEKVEYNGFNIGLMLLILGVSALLTLTISLQILFAAKKNQPVIANE